jgi:hypothetical protein
MCVQGEGSCEACARIAVWLGCVTVFLGRCLVREVGWEWGALGWTWAELDLFGRIDVGTGGTSRR